MAEQWKDICGYEGLYQVSTSGKIKGLKRHYATEKIRKPIKGNHGYLQVMLSKDGERKTFLVHRLVAEAFIQNPNGFAFVNHKDQNRHNNEAENLEWCNAQYNTDYSVSKCVSQYDKLGNLVRVWKSTKEVERKLGISNGNISGCCRGKLKTAGGYVWRYND